MGYDPNNVFARILRGEAPCIKVFEDSETLAMMDAMPQADGHVLVLPKEASETLLELSPAGAAACIVTAQRIARAVRIAVEAPGIVIAQVNGAAAGQTVPHVHFHVIPRWPERKLIAHGSVRADPAALREIAARIIAALDAPR